MLHESLVACAEAMGAGLPNRVQRFLRQLRVGRCQCVTKRYVLAAQGGGADHRGLGQCSVGERGMGGSVRQEMGGIIAEIGSHPYKGSPGHRNETVPCKMCAETAGWRRCGRYLAVGYCMRTKGGTVYHIADHLARY